MNKKELLIFLKDSEERVNLSQEKINRINKEINQMDKEIDEIL